MRYDYTAIPDAEIPVAAEPMFQHLVTTYVSECNKTASMWKAVPDACLDFSPTRERTPSVRSFGTSFFLSDVSSGSSSGRRNQPWRHCFHPAIGPASRRTLRSTFGCANCGCHSSPWERPRGGWSPGRFSAARCESESGCSGDGSCTPAIIGRRCKPGSGWQASMSQRFTGLPGM